MRNCEIAWLLGAQVIEKHFTWDKSLPGNDHYHAMDQDDLKRFVDRVNQDLTLLGDFRKSALPSESLARQNARRSLVAARPISAGKILDRDDLIAKRPAHGISPRGYRELVGRRAMQDIAEDTVLQWEMFTATDQ
jgi:N-acetylneuraminate synthase